MNTTPFPPAWHEVSIRIARKHLAAVDFYAKHYDVQVSCLLESMIYDHMGALTDDVFGMLEEAEANVNGEEVAAITLEFCPEAYALMLRVSQLLRRPLAEFLGDLADMAVSVLACYIEDALGKEGMSGPHMKDWADSAIKFRRHARQNHAPAWFGVADGWEAFNIKPRKLRLAR